MSGNEVFFALIIEQNVPTKLLLSTKCATQSQQHFVIKSIQTSLKGGKT